jgi:hypothetical protein
VPSCVRFLKLISLSLSLTHTHTHTHTHDRQTNLSSKYDYYFTFCDVTCEPVITFKSTPKQHGTNVQEQHCRSIPLKCERRERGWGVGMKSVLQDSGCSTSVGCNEKHGAAYKAVVTIVAVSVRGTSSVTSSG